MQAAGVELRLLGGPPPLLVVLLLGLDGLSPASLLELLLYPPGLPPLPPVRRSLWRRRRCPLHSLSEMLLLLTLPPPCPLTGPRPEEGPAAGMHVGKMAANTLCRPNLPNLGGGLLR